MKFVGDISLVPFLSDAFYSLLVDLVETSKQHRENISYPTGTVIIGVACLESYINELIHMTSFSQTERENSRPKRNLRNLKTDVIKKITVLKTIARKGEEISDELLEEFKLLIGLRGLLVRYEVQVEKPNDPG